MIRARSCAACLLLALTCPASAFPIKTERLPVDEPYPGTVSLHVDVSDLEHRVFRVEETIPVSPGPLTLYYPEWLPGKHAARGPIDALAGLTVSAGDRRLEWRRDPLDVYAFHIEIPQGVHRIELEFQYASPMSRRQGRIVATPDIVGLQWNTVLLYPAGYYASAITVEPSLTLPEHWQAGTALDLARQSGQRFDFKPVSLEILVDSPLFAGAHFRQLDLAPGSRHPVRLNVVADRAESLDVTDEQLEVHRRLVEQMRALIGAEHYDHYDFLLALSDHFSGIGLEHHRSSENGVGPGYFSDWKKDAEVVGRDLLAHEYFHSWNGKFRRGADLWTPHYNTPMQDSLLWVYEGMTQYYGKVLAARSGLWERAFALECFAATAAVYEYQRPGRRWRSLQDTTHQPIITPRLPLSYTSWQRSEDYYNEGLLLWLGVDTIIREKSRGRKSLDDFARAFFGGDDGVFAPKTYVFEDVVRTLDDIVAFDWAGYLRERLDGHPEHAPIDGLARGGWTLRFDEQPSAYEQARESHYQHTDLAYSLGLSIGQDGEIGSVVWDAPAFNAGLSPAMKIVAVNGREYSGEAIRQAITRARSDTDPIVLLIKDFDRYREVRIDYHGGLRYPRLERADGKDWLGAILKPLK